MMLDDQSARAVLRALPWLPLVLAAFLGIRWVRGATARRLQAKADNTRRERDQKRGEWLKRAPHVAPQRMAEITDKTASELLAAMRHGRLSCEDVVSAFCLKAARVGDKTNAVTEEAYDEALARAREVDALRASGGETHEQLLLGVPVSIKDCVQQRGFRCTDGLACRADDVWAEDGLLVELLRDAGAIPYVRTNVPQLLMLPESDNHVWGRTANPWNAERGPGGSSGGEAALVAARGSPLGLGTDIGGSIRIPAHYCGICGFKPTPQRMSTKGMVAPRLGNVSGQEGILSVAGPLARSVDDLVLMMRSLWVKKMWERDVLVPPLPFNLAAYQTRPSALRVGYLETLDWWPASDPCQRAVRESVEALRAAGHTVVPFRVPMLERAIFATFTILTADAGRYMIEALKGEPTIKAYNTIMGNCALPSWLRPIVRNLTWLFGERRLSGLVAATGAKSAYEYWQAVIDRKECQAAFVQEFKDKQLDVLLTPGSALPALQHGGSEHLPGAFCYTFLFNLLHTPAGIVPVTTVRPEEDGKYEDRAHADAWTKRSRTAMQGAAGLPVGVQVVGLPFRDETVLQGMKVLEELLPFAGRPSLDVN